MPVNPREMIAALNDALTIKAGVMPSHPHPLAEQVAEMDMKDIAIIAGELTAIEQGRRPTNDAAILGMGLTRSDFGMAMGDAMSYLAANRYDAFADHLPLCADLPVADFKEISFPDISADVALQETRELQEHTAASVIPADGTVKAQLRTYGRIISVSRQSVINDDIGLLANIFASMGTSAARIENEQVFTGLESNPNLQDGEPLFHEDLGNTESSALSAEALASAVGKLRTMPLRRDEPANTKARFLVTAPELEMPAHRLNREHGNRLEVIASPHIKTGRWYVFADPEVAPVIQRLTLKGASGKPVMIEPQKRNITFDGIRLKARADIGIAITGRSGVVRGGIE